MYCILKILNNNALLAKVKEDDSERILLGKGIGFGRKAGDEFTEIPGASVYTPVVREERNSTMNVVNPLTLSTSKQQVKLLRQQSRFLIPLKEIFYCL